MFLKGLGAVYEIEGEIPENLYEYRKDFFSGLPQLMDIYLKVKQAYLTLQSQALVLDPISQVGQLKELSTDVDRLRNLAWKIMNNLIQFGNDASSDITKLNYMKSIYEKANVHTGKNPGEGQFFDSYRWTIKQISELTGTTAVDLAKTTETVSSFSSVIAGLKAQLGLAKQQLAASIATLETLRKQALSLGITSW